MRALRTLLPSAVAAVVVLAATACGGGHKAAEVDAQGAGSPGAKVFADGGCGSCHTLAVAGSKGNVGPNLDELRPNQQRVERQVRNGGNGMPAFAGKLSRDEIQQVASFVATSAGTGRAGKISFEPDNKKVEDCRGDTACFEQAFGNLAYKEGPKVALERLDALSRTDPTVQGDCHPIAHKIGAGGLLHFQGNVGKAFADGNGTCGSGYYHGLLQWKLAGVKADQVASVARSACNAPEIKVNAFIYYQCDHGLGHGLMLYTAYDLPLALKFCHQLATEFDQTSCSGGVFMENLSSSFGLRTKWLNAKNLLYPCNIVGRRDKLYCYLLVSSRILPAVGWNWRKAADWCRRSEHGWVDICFQSYGRDVSGVARHNPDQIRNLCSLAGSGQKECLYGAVRDVLNNDSRDLGAKDVCEKVAQKFRARCFFGVGSILGTQHADVAGKKTACQEFARGKDLTDCLSGAGA